MLSIVCCLLAYVVGIAYVRLQNSSDSPLERNNPTAQPLLPNPEQLSEMGLAINTIANDRPLFLVSLVFFIAAISKATRPLFTSYIQRRYGVSPTMVSSSIVQSFFENTKLIFVGSTALAHANRHVDSHICTYLTVGGAQLPASNILSNQDRFFGR